MDEAHAHRRIEKDRHAEDQADPEAVAHVAHHVLHVHAGAVAHLVGHGVRLSATRAMAGRRQFSMIIRWSVLRQARTTMLGMIAMHVVTGVVFLLWSEFAESEARTVAEMLGLQRSGTMVATAFDGFLDRRDSDPALVVGHSGATGNRVDGGPRDTIKPHQLLLHSQCTERREKLSYV